MGRTFKSAILVFLILAFLLTPALAADKKLVQYRWKMATLAPDGVGWARHIKDVVMPALRDATDGNMAVKIYWGGVMGDEEEYVKKMRIGQLQGAGFAGQGATLVCPEMAVLELPFMFRSWQEVDYIKRVMSPTFDGLMRENGYFMLAWADQDFDQIYSIGKPIADVADFAGQRFVEWYGPIEVDTLEALKAQPIPVQVPEITAAVRQGQFDAAIGPGLWIVGAQLYTVIKYVNPMKIRYSPSLITVTMDAWNELPEEYKEKLYTERDKIITEYCRRLREDNEKGLQAMVDYGMTKVVSTDKQIAAIKEKTRPVWLKLADDLYPRELLDELVANLDDFRAGKTKGRIKDTWSGAVRSAAAAAKPAAPAAKPAAPAAPATVAPSAPAAAAPAETPEQPEYVAAPGLLAQPAGSQEVPLDKAAIAKVQQRLKDLGYYNLAVDGITGPRTFWGIRRFQKDKGLQVTGKIDAELLKALGI
ncbi:MAG: TRAP transporter substrate-binding protein DctP [Thermodesulfobacteriota bacterium]